MNKYWIYYRKDPTFRLFGTCPEDRKFSWQVTSDLETVLVNPAIYQFVSFQVAEHKDKVFSRMQGDVWSPCGEAMDLILALGLQHTSMSVGDIIVEEGGNVYEVDGYGWKQIMHNYFSM